MRETEVDANDKATKGYTIRYCEQRNVGRSTEDCMFVWDGTE